MHKVYPTADTQKNNFSSSTSATSSETSSVLSLKNVRKRYDRNDIFVLKNVSLSLRASEFVALLGPSGSGKSTLLHIAGLLDSPTDGTVIIGKKLAHSLSDDEKTSLRLSKIGFVYQYHHLLQEFSAVENVMLPQLIAGVSKNIAREKAADLLNRLALQHKLNSLPSELSGGQKQRVAIARALANDPIILLADEPTGNLDYETAMLVFDDLLEIMQRSNMAAIIATHNNDLVKKMDRTYLISEGQLLEK
jgi:lipoprotein-releasing system ATP-binding protein